MAPSPLKQIEPLRPREPCSSLAPSQVAPQQRAHPVKLTRRAVLEASAALAVGAAVNGCSFQSDLAALDDQPSATNERGEEPMDEFSFLVDHATRAANNHNTQSWRFRREAQGVTILTDMARATPVVDPHNRHLFASLGCAAENLRVAATHKGKASEIRGVGEGDAFHVAIELGAQGSAAADPLFKAIRKRQSTRSLYDSRPVPAADLAALKSSVEACGCDLHLIEDPRQKERFLEIAVPASNTQISDPAFKKELKQWLRFSTDYAQKMGDGLFSACSGNPRMPEFAGGWMFELFYKPDAEAEKLTAQVRSSAGLAIILSRSDSAAAHMTVGRAYQRLALRATTLGIKNALINQAIEVESAKQELANWLKVPAYRPALIVRYGYAEALPYSYRRPLAEVVV